jgi:hypothetical protein
VLLAACLAVSACSFLGEQVAVTTANSCIKYECEAEQGKARQACVALCQKHYGP